MSNARKLADNLPSQGSLSGRNMLINGDMRIAQRSTAAHNEGNGYFSLDRWYQEKTNHDQFTYSVEQVSDAPSGFSKCLRVTTSTAETALAADEFSRIYQSIEGNDLERVGFGTADAKPLTLSFWVKSSITGNWSASLYIYDANKIYSQAYTINSANTWEYKTLTFPALTSGGPVIDNSVGARVIFGLFAGSDYSTATTDWTTFSNTYLIGGQTANLAATLNSSWRITGVQLEVGSQSTPFEHEPVGVTLRKCQRYYWQAVGSGPHYYATQYSSGYRFVQVDFGQEMRATPTVTVSYAAGASLTNYLINRQHWKAYLAANYDVSASYRSDVLKLDAEL